MNLLFWKREESPVRMVIKTLRASIGEFKKLDGTKKEAIAEHVRHLWLIQANAADEISKSNQKEGKKLTRQAEQDEAELARFLADVGVGRYSPEDQQTIDKAELELAALAEEVKTSSQEMTEARRITEERIRIIERKANESIKAIERQLFKTDPVIASKEKLKEWLRFRR